MTEFEQFGIIVRLWLPLAAAVLFAIVQALKQSEWFKRVVNAGGPIVVVAVGIPLGGVVGCFFEWIAQVPPDWRIAIGNGILASWLSIGVFDQYKVLRPLLRSWFGISDG